MTPRSRAEVSRLRLKCDGTYAETRFHLSAKRTSPFKSAGASVQSTTCSRSVRISSSNGSDAGYNMFRGSVKSTGYPLHSPVSPSLPFPCVTVCHRISTGIYKVELCTSKPPLCLHGISSGDLHLYSENKNTNHLPCHFVYHKSHIVYAG